MGCLSAIENILMFCTCTPMLCCLQFCLSIEVSSISEVPIVFSAALWLTLTGFHHLHFRTSFISNHFKMTMPLVDATWRFQGSKLQKIALTIGAVNCGKLFFIKKPTSKINLFQHTAYSEIKHFDWIYPGMWLLLINQSTLFHRGYLCLWHWVQDLRHSLNLYRQICTLK